MSEQFDWKEMERGEVELEPTQDWMFLASEELETDILIPETAKNKLEDYKGHRIMAMGPWERRSQ